LELHFYGSFRIEEIFNNYDKQNLILKAKSKSKINMRWTINQTLKINQAFMQALNVEDFVATLLVQRIETFEDAKNSFAFLDHFHDRTMKDREKWYLN
jgi:hypothetical protein